MEGFFFFFFLTIASGVSVCLHLMKERWKAQSIPSAHIFIHWHRRSAKQRLRGRGLWNDNAHSGSSRQRHALLSARNVLTNRGRPRRQPPLLLYIFLPIDQQGSCTASPSHPERCTPSASLSSHRSVYLDPCALSPLMLAFVFIKGEVLSKICLTRPSSRRPGSKFFLLCTSLHN